MGDIMIESDSEKSDFSFDGDIIHDNDYGDPEFNPLIPESNIESPMTIAELKTHYLRDVILSKRLDYTHDKKLSLTCVTWNVNGREPTEDLSNMLPNEVPDLFVIGLQEIDRRAEAYVYNVSTRETLWIKACKTAIKSKYSGTDFKIIASKGLVGLLIISFVKSSHQALIGKISTASASCGIMGVVGNKGAVAIRFKLFESYLCFINCHLAAHPQQVIRRNQDLNDLHKRLLFPFTRSRSMKSKPKHEMFTDKYWGKAGFAKIDDCDSLFWLGDFNYRVDMDGQLARIFIHHDQISTVLQYDQMINQKGLENHILNFYSEAEITFAPSYSFDIGSDNYDSSEKQRIPSWCDRIIWRSSDAMSPSSYDCMLDYKSSDHKPVRLNATISIKVLQHDKYEKIYVDTLKTLDAFENATIPDTDVDRYFIEGDVLAFRNFKKESLKIFNKGKVMAQYRFIWHDNEKMKQPTWLRIDPHEGLIAPGDSVNVDLFFVYDHFVASSGQEEVSHILILHIEGGRDHFITVGFKCRPTFFAKPLDALKFHRVILLRNEPQLLFKVPTILWRLVDYLIETPTALKTEHLFLLSGTKELNDSIQDSLDLHLPFTEDINCDVGYHSVAETILRFFDSLSDSIIPSDLYEDCLKSSRNPAMMLEILEKLPKANFLVVEYMVRFLRDLLFTQNTSLSKLAIARVFGSVLMRPSKVSNIKYKSSNEEALFMQNLLNKQS